MHRFPNPGSSLDNTINCFIFLYKNIERDEIFDLHDMQELLVSNGLISSSGAMGIEALLRGASKDLSRDRSYNQCKMYAELYRSLGWIQSNEKALWYNFTLLGDHIANATIDRKKIVEQCFLGMEYPTSLIDVNGSYIIRPFATILKTMNQLNGVLSRDEMIIGPLSIDDDTDQNLFNSMCHELKELRKSKSKFDAKFASCLKSRKITSVTARNYTRFPLGALKWLDWAQPTKNSSNYSTKQQTYKLTEHGKEVIDSLDDMLDIRVKDLNNKSIDSDSLIYHSFYKSLNASGFDTSPLAKNLTKAQEKVTSDFGTPNILFSPFQAVSKEVLSRIFKIKKPTKKRVGVYSPDKLLETKVNKSLQDELNTTLVTNEEDVNYKNEFYDSVISLLKTNTQSETVSILKDSFITHTKDEFYPLIGNIFSSIGIKCDIPPHGVNSRRWDAILLSSDDSIPIEIKSPTEEINLSVKAIRQALENKIILQSRKSEKNKWSTCTLAIGFELPNKRAEVLELINDIKKIYDINIAVFGIEYLLKISVNCISENKKIEFSELINKKGILNG